MTVAFASFGLCCWCRSLCRHRSALVGQIDRLVPHRDLLVAHSQHLVPRLPAICRQLDRRLPIGDMIASIDSLGASFAERNSHSLMRSRPRVRAELAANACRAMCAAPRLDVLLDVMRSSPEVLQFVPHICQHAEELGSHLEVLADHIGDLGAYSSTAGNAVVVPAQALTLRSHPRLPRPVSQHRVQIGCWSATAGWRKCSVRAPMVNPPRRHYETRGGLGAEAKRANSLCGSLTVLRVCDIPFGEGKTNICQATSCHRATTRLRARERLSASAPQYLSRAGSAGRNFVAHDLLR